MFTCNINTSEDFRMKYWLLLALVLPLVACGEEQSSADDGQSKIHSGDITVVR